MTNTLTNILNKGKEHIGKIIALAVVLGGTFVAENLIENSPSKNYLTSKDFEKAQWIEFYNNNGRIWSCYTNEHIPKNQSNWHLYEGEVRKKNNNYLKGNILLPDLDGNGEVGKRDI